MKNKKSLLEKVQSWTKGNYFFDSIANTEEYIYIKHLSDKDLLDYLIQRYNEKFLEDL